MKDKLGLFLQNWRIKEVLPFIQGSLLDVGCGTNQLCAQYKKRHPSRHAVGVDVYPWPGVDQIIENSGQLPFDNALFDTIACIASLNHIPERDTFLKEASRLLTPNGHLIITMIPPAISKVWHIIRSPWDADQHERGMEEGEVYGFSDSQMEKLLQKASLQIITRKRFMLGINTIYIIQNKTFFKS